MNFSKITLLSLSALLLAAPSSFARTGGIGDGGGHGFSSTPQEVRDYLQKPWAAWGGTKAEVDFRTVHLDLDFWMALSPDYAPNSIVKKVLQAARKAFPGDKFKNAIINKTFAVSEACYDHDGALSDGSTTIGRLDAPICLNANSLARYPAEELNVEIVALLYHEWTHQLGFGEREAVEVQGYIKHLLPLVFSVDRGTYPRDLPLREGGVRTFMTPGKDPLSVYCVNIDRWWKDYDKENGQFPGGQYSMTIFTGQAVVVGGVTVSCSDLPQVDCRVEAANDKDCKGSRVFFGQGSENSACLNSPLFRYKSLQELQAAKVCK